MIEKISNIEEKKRIIVFYKCLFNKYPTQLLCNSRIYDVWLRMWKDDFVVDGKCLKMWHQKFVESVGKHRLKIEPPVYYAEYNALINSATDFANRNYDIKASKSKNQQHCKEVLKEYRYNCLNELNNLLNKSSKKELSVIQSNPKELSLFIIMIWTNAIYCLKKVFSLFTVGLGIKMGAYIMSLWQSA